MKADDNTLIRFGWAAKKMLRDKANFEILEGLVSVLINDKVKIEEILESEGNQDHARDKFNRVDIKARNSEGHIIIVEIQLTRQLHFLERMLYGVAKTITEYISLGDDYDKVRKVYSINILYCDLGVGEDYVYHGVTHFRGIHTGDELMISQNQKDAIPMRTAASVYPEYFIIRVKEFNKIPESPLDEWMDYLKSGNIKEDTTAPGLKKARKQLKVLKMSDEEREAYQKHLDNLAFQNDVLATYHEEGRVEGLAEGRAEEKFEIARNLKSMGIDIDTIIKATGLTPEQIDDI